ncbi:MAG: hypothetical protein M1837_005938 [Sclerophora amabilis]|nr:MAG: hypothetical protein M1837_005938 [Sclerophora amabilis]
MAAGFTASFTHYDDCGTASMACGFWANGYAVAVSENLFGVGPGAGAGPACNTCYRITGHTDGLGKLLPGGGKSIVVKVDNLCPGKGNPKCSQTSLQDQNELGKQVNFDLCNASGASKAFFPEGQGLVLGVVEKVECTEWKGTDVRA